MRRFLDYRQILNRKHPLNRGLVSEWVVLPGLAGGKYLFDICGSNRGTLTNGPTWASPGGRPGGFGSLLFDGSNDEVRIATSASLQPASTTVAMWVRVLATNSVAFVVDDNGRGPQFYIPSGGQVRWLCAYTLSGSNIVTGSITINDGGWHRLMGTYQSGSGGALYVDGRPDGTFAVGTGDIPWAADDWVIGSNDGSLFFNGYADGLTAWNRAFTPAQAMQEFCESRAGNPNRYNWLYPERMSYLEYVTKTVPIGINYEQYFSVQYQEQV